MHRIDAESGQGGEEVTEAFWSISTGQNVTARQPFPSDTVHWLYRNIFK